MLEALISEFAQIEDPRCDWRVEHQLIDILVIAVCAVIGEAESFEDIALYGRCKQDWLQRFLELPNGIPSHDTFRRVLMLVDPERFERCFLGWVRAVFRPGEGAPRQIAIDGKTVRRSFDRRHGRSPLHLVSAYATEHGLVLAQRADRAKKGRADGAARTCSTASTCAAAWSAWTRSPAGPRSPSRSWPGRRLSARAQGQPEEGPRRGEGLVRGQRLRARRPAPAALLRRLRRRPRPAGAPAGVRLHRTSTPSPPPRGLAGPDGGAGGRDHPRRQRHGQGHGRDPALSLQQQAAAGAPRRPPSEAIGRSRTGCTGSSTSASARTRAGCASATRPGTWRLLRKIALNLARGRHHAEGQPQGQAQIRRLGQRLHGRRPRCGRRSGG